MGRHEITQEQIDAWYRRTCDSAFMSSMQWYEPDHYQRVTGYQEALLDLAECLDLAPPDREFSAETD